MAGNRTLKLSILADVDDLNKKLKSANGDVESSSNKLGEFSKKAGVAFAAAAAAAGAYATKLAVDGVKAAIEDEKAQTQLAIALENATGATNAQIKATEDSILQMSLASGVADDTLRPALGRLVRSTGDITKAQDLLAIALDVSTATGKPLEAIANSLGKAYDGNTAALGKLGLGLDSAELKTMTFTEVQDRLTQLFGGAAAANADTYAGKIARVQIAFDEAKETLGQALLPILDKFLGFINENALPAIQAFTSAFSLTEGDGFGKTISDVGSTIKTVVQPIFEGVKVIFDKVKKAVMDSRDEFASFWEVIKFVAPLIGKAIGDSLKVVGEIAGVVITLIGKVLGAIKPLLNTAIDGINKIITGLNFINPGKDIPYIQKIGDSGGSDGTGGFSGTMPNGQTFTTQTYVQNAAERAELAAALARANGITSGTGTTTGGSTGTTTGGNGTTGIAGVSTAVAAAVSIGSFDVGRFRMAENASMPSVYNINVTGALDKEGVARQIVEIINESSYRGGGGPGSALVA
jgi:hypothetical protein